MGSRESTSPAGTLGWLLAMAAVIAFAVWQIRSLRNAAAPSVSRPAPAQDRPAQTTPAAQMAARAAGESPEQYLANVASGMEYLTSHARDLASLRFANVRVMSETGSVCFTYRAQNGFGSMGFEQTAYDARRKSMVTHDDSSFREDWNAMCGSKASTDITEEAQRTLEAMQQRMK
jgi:hypothetical protein